VSWYRFFAPPLVERRQPASMLLKRGEITRLTGVGEFRRIECCAGKLWITQSGCEDDVVLSAGEKRAFCQAGVVLIEALTESKVDLG
jgi:hypothetical protein